MDRQYAHTRYTSAIVEDREEGYIGLELTQLRQGNSSRVARIVYWDASGEFVVETLGTEVPLPVLEELIVEVKERIRIR